MTIKDRPYNKSAAPAELLDRGLEDLTGSGASCKSSHGNGKAAAELELLLELAAACRRSFKIEASPARRAAVRSRVMAAAQARLRAPVNKRQLRRFLLRPAIAAAAILALSGATALAANSAGPDNILYPLKQKLEDARSFIAFGKTGRAAVAAGDAGKRLDEIKAMVAKGKPQYVSELLANYDRQIGEAQSLAAAAGREGDDVTAVIGMIDATRARHDALMKEIFNMVPANIQAVIRHEEGGAGPAGGRSAAGQRGKTNPSRPAGRAGGGNPNSGGSQGSSGASGSAPSNGQMPGGSVQNGGQQDMPAPYGPAPQSDGNPAQSPGQFQAPSGKSGSKSMPQGVARGSHAAGYSGQSSASQQPEGGMLSGSR